MMVEKKQILLQGAIESEPLIDQLTLVPTISNE